MPTPYQTLCEKYKNQRQLYFDHQWICGDFVNRLEIAFAAYIGLTRENVKLFPPDEKINEKENYTAMGALKLKEDASWHFDLTIIVEEAPNTWPKSRLVVEIWVRIVGKFLVVHVAGNGKSFLKFPLDEKYVSKSADLRPLCNRIVRVMNHLLEGSKRFLEKGKEEYEPFTELSTK
jgi:hypothetical protein